MSLADGEDRIEGDSNLINHATNFYKNLFGPAPGNTFLLNEELWGHNEKVSDDDNANLIKTFL